eukprot:5095571-Prymnesium_polylepis.1
MHGMPAYLQHVEEGFAAATQFVLDLLHTGPAALQGVPEPQAAIEQAGRMLRAGRQPHAALRLMAALCGGGDATLDAPGPSAPFLGLAANQQAVAAMLEESPPGAFVLLVVDGSSGEVEGIDSLDEAEGLVEAGGLLVDDDADGAHGATGGATLSVLAGHVHA